MISCIYSIDLTPLMYSDRFVACQLFPDFFVMQPKIQACSSSSKMLRFSIFIKTVFLFRVSSCLMKLMAPKS